MGYGTQSAERIDTQLGRRLDMTEYFTKEADRAISSLVIRYNSLDESDDEKLRLENIITERTRVLLYLIPLRACFIAEEDLSGFLLDVMKDIGRFISSYSISGTSYIAYLTQICRYRCMRYMRDKEKAERLESAMLHSEITVYDQPHALREKDRAYVGKFRPDYLEMDLRSLINAMIRNPKGECGRCSAVERTLGDALSARIDRRRFIEFLLYLPQSESPSFIAGVSRVMRVDGAVISRFFYLRSQYLDTDKEAISKLERVAGRYWTLINSIQQSICYETDTEKLRLLRSSLERISELHRRRRADLMKARRGLSQGQISKLLGIPRTTVSFDLGRMRQLLHDLQEENQPL